MYSITGAIDQPVFNTNFPPIKALDGFTWANVGGTFTNSEQIAPLELLPQADTNVRLFVQDSRIHNVVYRNGYLWTAQTILLPSSAPARAAVQWWQIMPEMTLIVQRGVIDDPLGVNHYAYGTIGVNKFNDVLVGCSKFSSNIYPSAVYAFRSFWDQPINQLRLPRVLRDGNTPITLPGYRFGDYSATVTDPTDDIGLWTIQEFANADSVFWSTWWGQIKPERPTNDLFAAAIVLPGVSGTTNAHNRRAGIETGEPVHISGNLGESSVWFKWTAPSNVNFIISVDDLSIPPIRRAIAVYTGTTVAGLTPVVTSLMETNGAGKCVLIQASANTTYYVAIDGHDPFPRSQGLFRLSWAINGLLPYFALEPKGTNILAGESVTFTGQAYGFPLPAFFWFSNSIALPTNGIVSTTSNSIYTIINAPATTNIYQSFYSLVASNSCGAVTSAPALLVVHPSTAAGMAHLQITNGSFIFRVTGVTNRNYTLQTSTNLNDPTNNWISIATDVVSFWHTNAAVTGNFQRFFRAFTAP